MLSSYTLNGATPDEIVLKDGSGWHSSTKPKRYTMNELEPYLRPRFGVVPLWLEDGLKLKIEINVFSTRFPMKLDAFMRKLRDYHFKKVRGKWEFINKELQPGQKISQLKPRYPTDRRGRALRARQKKPQPQLQLQQTATSSTERDSKKRSVSNISRNKTPKKRMKIIEELTDFDHLHQMKDTSNSSPMSCCDSSISTLPMFGSDDSSSSSSEDEATNLENFFRPPQPFTPIFSDNSFRIKEEDFDAHAAIKKENFGDDGMGPIFTPHDGYPQDVAIKSEPFDDTTSPFTCLTDETYSPEQDLFRYEFTNDSTSSFMNSPYAPCDDICVENSSSVQETLNKNTSAPGAASGSPFPSGRPPAPSGLKALADPLDMHNAHVLNTNERDIFVGRNANDRDVNDRDVFEKSISGAWKASPVSFFGTPSPSLDLSPIPAASFFTSGSSCSSPVVGEFLSSSC